MTVRIPVLLHLLAAAASGAAEPDGQRTIDAQAWVRWRLEAAEVEGRDDARAGTLAGVAGIAWRPSSGWLIGLSGEAVAVTGPDSYGEAGSTSGPAVIEDPEHIGVHEAFLRWSGGAWSLTAGRQSLTFPGHEWVSAQPWRQNRQSLDGLDATWTGGGWAATAVAVFQRSGTDGTEERQRSLLARGVREDARLGSLAVELFAIDGRDAAEDGITAGVVWDRPGGADGAWGAAWRAAAYRQSAWADAPDGDDRWLVDLALGAGTAPADRVVAGWRIAVSDGLSGPVRPYAADDIVGGGYRSWYLKSGLYGIVPGWALDARAAVFEGEDGSPLGSSVAAEAIHYADWLVHGLALSVRGLVNHARDPSFPDERRVHLAVEWTPSWPPSR